MADLLLTQMTEMTTPAAGDWMYLVDISDISDHADGSSRRITRANFLQISGNVVGHTDTQTLTNKTIDADNNTLSNLAHGAEVDNPSGGVHGVSGDVVGTTDIQTLSNKTFTKPTVNASVHTVITVTYGATTTFDLALSNHQEVVLTGNPTLAVSNFTDDQTLILHLIQDGTGSRTVTWWANIKWPDDTVPTLTTTADKTDTFVFIRRGSNYLGYIIDQNL